MQNLQGTSHDDRHRNATIELAKSEALKTVAYALLRQVYGMTEQQMPDVQRSINFFDEVRKFEVNLIRQALLYANGRQKAAARLLRINPTTLHSKIKLYGIEIPMTGDPESADNVFTRAARR